jgi:hypothetical protein
VALHPRINLAPVALTPIPLAPLLEVVGRQRHVELLGKRQPPQGARVVFPARVGNGTREGQPLDQHVQKRLLLAVTGQVWGQMTGRNLGRRPPKRRGAGS